MEVKWSAEAIEDLRRIYIQQSFTSKKAAQRICARISSDADILENHPMAGKKEPYLENREYSYRSLVTKEPDYKLVYYIEDNQINIIAVWDCRRDPEDMAKEIKQQRKE